MNNKNNHNSLLENSKKNLKQHLKEAISSNDKNKIQLIQRIENEIEKLLLLREIRKHKKLLEVFKNNVLSVQEDASYHLIEAILSHEIELLANGDIESIEMLEKLKKKAQKKIDELSKLSLKIVENQKRSSEQMIKRQDKEEFVNSNYKPLIAYDGFHIERSLGGEIIQVLDADIKNLVNEDIINSKPQDLTKFILDEIKNIKKDPFYQLTSNQLNSKELSDANHSNQDLGKWTKLVIDEKNINDLSKSNHSFDRNK